MKYIVLCANVAAAADAAAALTCCCCFVVVVVVVAALVAAAAAMPLVGRQPLYVLVNVKQVLVAIPP